MEITKVVLIHCNIDSNKYQQNSRVLHKFVPDKSFGKLLDISRKVFIFLKTFAQNFYILNEIWFTDQNSQPLEIEDEINITFVVN